jgi:hypothetical protein
MLSSNIPRTARSISALCALCLLLLSCGSQPPVRSERDKAQTLAGTWLLQSRIVDGKETPATKRQMKIVVGKDGTFLFRYRGNDKQQWIDAGEGGVSFIPPHLKFFWDTGQTQTLLVLDGQPDRMRLHHGRNLAPLKDQQPDEIFVREKAAAKGPKRRPS